MEALHAEWMVGFLVVAAACVGAAARPVIFPVAGAAAPAEKCDWRYLASGLDIPEGSENKPMDAEWSAMSNAGYHLVAPIGTTVFVFERCVPAQP